MDRIWTTHDDDIKIGSATPIQNGSRNENAACMVGVQSKFRRKYYHKTIFTILIFIIFILIIAIIIIACHIYMKDEICYSKECLQTSATFIQNMDISANPCEDFFQYMCGKFENEHPIPDTSTSHDWFTEKQSTILREIRKRLNEKQNDDDPYPVKQTKMLYKSCIDTHALDKLGFQPLFHFLKLFNLPKIPTLMTNPEIQDFQFDWIKTVVKIKRSLGADKVIGFEVFSDPKNRSVNYLALGSPSQENDLPLVDDVLSKRIKKVRRNQWVYLRGMLDNERQEMGDGESSEEEDVSLLAYNAYMKEVIIAITKKADLSAPTSQIMSEIQKVIEVTIDISKNVYSLVDAAENASKLEDRDGNLSDLIYINVLDLQKMVDDEISAEEKTDIFKRYMKLMLEGVPETQFDVDEDLILSSNPDIFYLKNVIKLIYETNPLHLEAFLWWSVVEELILYTTSTMRHLYHEYTRAITGVESSSSRPPYCTSSINKLMGYAVSYLIIDKDFIVDTKPKVERMVSNIRKSFNNIIYHSDWIDWQTKERSLQKSDKMKSLIGFPEWILNKTELEMHYKGVRIKGDTWMENIIELLSWQFMDKLTKFRMNNEYDWAITPSNVNAFHTFQANAITIPFAILQFPFYQLGLEALNYGSIGTVLAHELTHGFDDIGRHFDENGNKNYWWTNNTISAFLNRTECFKRQYSEYSLPEIGDYINGEITLGENIADNGGLRESFYGYHYHLKSVKKERKLPGFESFSHEQLFFMSYGNLWCETMTVIGMKYALEDTHCPGRIRLLGVLSNSREFHNAFNCHVGQKYHRTDDQKCIIW